MKKTELTEKELDAIAAAGQANVQAAEEFKPVTPADMPKEQTEAAKKAFEDMQKAIDKLQQN